MGQETQSLERSFSFTASDGARIPAFLAEPPGVVNAPRIVIAPEFAGLTPWVKSVAHRLAREGFRAVAVEIFARDPLPPGADTKALVARVARTDFTRAVEDLWEGLRELGHEGRAGAIGFCMGGTLALLLAAEGGVQAAVSCYGRVLFAGLDPLRPEHPIEAATRIRCPTLGIYGAKDPSIPVADVTALARVLPEGSEVALFDAGHAFLNDTRPDMYVEEAATLAWAKVEGFLNRLLT